MKRMAVLVGALALAGMAQAQKLTTYKFPDGSGQVGVAPGWRVKQSGQGMVQLSGPGGADVTLGVPLFVLAHNADELARQRLAGTGVENMPNLGGDPRVPHVHHTDPVLATLDILQLLQRQGMIKNIRVKGVEAIPNWPNGRAAYVRLSVVLQGKPMESFSLVAVMPTDENSGMYYTSGVTAPAGSYAHLLPQMFAMWRSWNLSPALVRERLESARKTLAQIDVVGTYDAATMERRRAAQRGARLFQDYINGESNQRDRWGRKPGDTGYEPGNE